MELELFQRIFCHHTTILSNNAKFTTVIMNILVLDYNKKSRNLNINIVVSLYDKLERGKSYNNYISSQEYADTLYIRNQTDNLFVEFKSQVKRNSLINFIEPDMLVREWII